MCLQDLTLPVGNRHCKLPTNIHSSLQSSLFCLSGHEVDVNSRLYKSATALCMASSRRFEDQRDSGHTSELPLTRQPGCQDCFPADEDRTGVILT